jgi:glycine cleavage system H lipoate-binding protein
MGRGWIFKIKIANAGEVASLLSEADYAAFLKTLA